MQNFKEQNKQKLCRERCPHRLLHQQGITLIALIITIIIMLILVTVSITLAINGDLFNKAGDVAIQYDDAIVAEQNEGITIGGKLYASIDEYLNAQNSGIIIEYTVEGLEIELRASWMDGTETYEEFAMRNLEGKNQTEEEAIFLEGVNFWNEYYNNKYEEDNPIYTTISELLEDWGYVTIEALYEGQGFEELLINGKYVYPDQYDFDNYGIIIIDPNEERTLSSIANFTAPGGGSYNFLVANEIGTKENSLTINIEERFSEIYESTETYTDKNGDTATIPEGFEVGTSDGINTIDDGLVIQDSSGNQFVWIPVANINDMAIYQTEYTYGTGEYSGGYYHGKFYRFSETTATEMTSQYVGIGRPENKEPVLITDSDLTIKDGINAMYSGIYYDAVYYLEIGFESIYEFGEHMLVEYQNMVNSVKLYKGFYVGRYETSLTGTNTVQSKANQNPAETSWYNLYYYQDSTNCLNNPYNENASVVSGMITGSQWDAMLRFILTGIYSEHVTASTYGNHGEVAFTGHTTTDKCNNIYDLEGNASEWTMEAYGYYQRQFRSLGDASGRHISGYGYDGVPTINSRGSRCALYIQ